MDNDKVEDEQQQKAEKKYEIMMEFINREVDTIASANRDLLYKQFDNMKEAYTKSLEADEDHMTDDTFYTAEKMHKYGIEFLSYVDPLFT